MIKYKKVINCEYARSVFKMYSSSLNLIYSIVSEHLIQHNRNIVLHIDKYKKLQQIITTEDSYKILVTGPPGIGKTYLTRQAIRSVYGDTVLQNKYDQSFSMNNSFLIPIDENLPIIIDLSDDYKQSYKEIDRLNNYYSKCIVASRPDTQINIKDYTHVIYLFPLNQAEINKFIMSLDTNAEWVKSTFYKHFVTSQFSNIPLTPTDILCFIVGYQSNDNFINFYNQFQNFLYQYGHRAEFSSDIILPNKKIITPPKEIIRGISHVDKTLLQKAKDDPNIMFKFTPREFERMICELFEKQGYNVKLTKQTRDGGKDIIILNSSILGDFCVYVECKKYAKTRPVGVGIVRELYGNVTIDDATAGIIMTTSYFTKDAKELCETVKSRMSLRDYHDIVKELSKI